MSGKSPFLEEAPHGVYIKLHIQPGAKRDGVAGIHGTSLKVKINAPPVEGAANTALVDFLSGLFGVKKKSITITSGLRSRDKRVFVASLKIGEVKRIISGRLKGVS